MKQFATYICLIMLTSCSSNVIEPVRPALPNNNHPIKIIWQKHMFEGDTSKLLSSNAPSIWKGEVIYVLNGKASHDYIISRDALKGDLMWEWTDPIMEDIAAPLGMALEGDNYIFTDGLKIFNLDLVNLSHQMQRRNSYNSPRLSVFKNLISHTNGDAPTDFDISTLSIYTSGNIRFSKELLISKENGYSPDIEPPIAEINSKGDTILYFINRLYNFNIGDGKCDVYAYNLSKDSIVWRVENVAPSGNTSVHAPLQDENFLYIPGQRTPICMRKSDGKVMWKKELPSGFLSCNMLLHEGVLYLNGGDEKFFALNARTGQQLWQINDESYACPNMQIYKDKIYYASRGTGKLFCVDIKNPKLLWAYDSPQDEGWKDAGFWHGITIDPSTGYLYTSDGWYMMCIDLNKME